MSRCSLRLCLGTKRYSPSNLPIGGSSFCLHTDTYCLNGTLEGWALAHPPKKTMMAANKLEENVKHFTQLWGRYNNWKHKSQCFTEWVMEMRALMGLFLALWSVPFRVVRRLLRNLPDGKVWDCSCCCSACPVVSSRRLLSLKISFWENSGFKVLE